MSDLTLVKQVFNEMIRLDSLGFSSWVSNVKSFACNNSIDFHGISNTSRFRSITLRKLVSVFKETWLENINNISRFPLLRSYRKFKQNFISEPYLTLVLNENHRKSITRLRVSSHHLAIETGRWQKPKVDEKLRLCTSCRVIEDELHFLCHCRINRRERATLKNELFANMSSNLFLLLHENLFHYLMTSTDQTVLRALGKFVFNSFKTRDHYLE